MSLVIDFRDSLHRHVERELPWYVNGRLDETHRRRIGQHLSGCGQCRREEAQVRKLQAQLAQPLAVPAPAPDFARLARRIAAADAAPKPVAGRADPRRWLLPLGLAQAAVLLLVLVPALRAPQAPAPAQFRTLGAAAAPAAGPRALMVFRPETTLADARRLLQANGASILEGPNAAGAYLVALPSRRPEQAVAALRRAPGVLLAERVDREPAP